MDESTVAQADRPGELPPGDVEPIQEGVREDIFLVIHVVTAFDIHAQHLTKCIYTPLWVMLRISPEKVDCHRA